MQCDFIPARSGRYHLRKEKALYEFKADAQSLSFNHGAGGVGAGAAVVFVRKMKNKTYTANAFIDSTNENVEAGRSMSY